MNVVIDTNVLVSGIFWNGSPRKFLALVFHQDIKPFATIDMMAEYCRIIDKVANKRPDIATKWKSQIAKMMTIIEKSEVVDSQQQNVLNALWLVLLRSFYRLQTA